MFDMKSILALLSAVGPAVSAATEFKQVFDQIVATFGSGDQDTLRAAYEDVMADNDEGHRRLQAKLSAASGATPTR